MKLSACGGLSQIRTAQQNPMQMEIIQCKTVKEFYLSQVRPCARGMLPLGQLLGMSNEAVSMDLQLPL